MKKMILTLSIAWLAACASSDSTSSETPMPEDPVADGAVDTDDSSTSAPPDYVSETLACRYDNTFSGFSECKEYRGMWLREDIAADCGEVFRGVSGEISAERCERDAALGTCEVEVSAITSTVTFYYGGDLGVTASMCDSFLGGTWEATEGEEPVVPDSEDFGFALESMVSNDAVTVSPECLSTTCVQTLAANEEGIWFRPTQTTSTTGLIIYPGGAVDPRAYAPAAQTLAAMGFTVVIVPMPGNFAFSAFERANVMIESEPSIESWFLGGHSAGGAAAIMYAARTEVQIDGMFLLAAYGSPDDDLSASSLPVLSIFGTNDGVTTLDEIDTSKLTLPATTLYVELQGANHAQFGYYGDQDRDFTSDIAQEDQHQLYTSAIAHFVYQTLEQGETPQHPGFEEARQLGIDWCKTAQTLVGGVEDGSWIDVTMANNLATFAESKPLVGEESRVEVQAFSRALGNPSELYAPSIIMGEAWCKMKQREALPADLVNSVATSCREVNEAALSWALEQLSVTELERYQEVMPQLNFDADQLFETGSDWLYASSVEFDGVNLRAARLSIDLSRDDMPNESRGVHYCKTWSPAQALLWVLTQL